MKANNNNVKVKKNSTNIKSNGAKANNNMKLTSSGTNATNSIMKTRNNNQR
jgi:hypothetical protein